MHHTNAAAAYHRNARSTSEPRSVEYKVFLKTNGRLIAARDNPDLPFTFTAEAIHENMRLWTLLAVDAASEQNKLPKQLRAQIISLSLFMQKLANTALKGNAGLDAMIEINGSMMRGLAAREQAESGGAAPAGATMAGAA